MVGAALPEAAAEPFNVADAFVLVGEVHFPDEGAVAEDPHDSINGHCRGNEAAGWQPTREQLKTSTSAKNTHKKSLNK